MHSYKFYYFGIQGKGEVVRMMFQYAGEKADEMTINFPDWPAQKDQFPLGQLPVLEVDGVKYSQSGAILRFLAKQFGLTGKTDVDALRIDSYAEFFATDIWQKFPALYGLSGSEKKAEREAKRKELAPVIKCLLDKFAETFIKDGQKFLCGDELTYADLVLRRCVDEIQCTTFPSEHANVIPAKMAAIADNVYNHPKLHGYLSGERKPSHPPFMDLS